jgi:hypothetical protein
MKKFTTLCLSASLLSIPLANAATIIVGDDGDQTPAGPTPNLDGASPLIIVDYQANLYTNTSGGTEVLTVDTFNFYAQGNGDVAPFVALLTGAGSAAGDFDVLAVGDTRTGGVDFTAGGVVSLPFAGATPTISVPAGGILVGGIQQGRTAGNVVPFNINSGLNTFLTGGTVGDPAVSVGSDIQSGGSTWASLNGGRNYEYTIELNTIPEPTTATLLPAVLGGLLLLRRRR